MSVEQETTNQIPYSVRKQGEMADKIMKEGLNTQDEGSGTPEGESGEPQGTQHPEGEGGEEPQPQAGAGQEGEPEPEPEPQPEGNEGKETWKDKYKVLKGKYDAEVPRLQQQMKDLQEQVRNLTADNQQLRDQAASNQPSQPSGGEGPQGKLNPEDFADYGDEFQQLVREMNALRDENESLKEKTGTVEQTVGSVQEHQRQTAEQRFWSDLDSEVSQWRKINEDQDFLSWLDEVDRLSGKRRQELLEEAHQAMNVNRVAAIFNHFVENTEVGAKYRSGASREDTGKQQGKERKRPKQNVQPSRSRAESPPAEEGKRTWTRQQINEFYNQRNKGAWKGREDEADKIERDIFQAVDEGRVTD